MDVRATAEKNRAERLAANPYPGRGLALGQDENGARLIQAYWIMGRSPNSRNRVFETDGSAVWTEAADPAQLKDPSLIIYNALRELRGVYVVTNGDQTDTICQTLLAGGTFEQALATRAYEPDEPNWTPRISGMFDLRGGLPVAKLSVLRRSAFGPATDRLQWQVESFGPGLGHCITTYMGDGKPLPAFQGEPFLLPLRGDLASIADSLWDSLNAENRVSLCAKAIDPATLRSQVVVINQYERK
jgi:IMP cyclohydrolase